MGAATIGDDDEGRVSVSGCCLAAETLSHSEWMGNRGDVLGGEVPLRLWTSGGSGPL